MLLKRPQPVNVLVEVADLSRVSSEGNNQERADRFEFGQCFVGTPGGGEHLGEGEAGSENLVRLLVARGAGVVHVEP